MHSSLHKTWLILAVISVTRLSFSQSTPIMLSPCPECALAGQTPASEPVGPPQVVYLQNPKPSDLGKMFEQSVSRTELRFELTARVVSTRPLILDVLDVGGPAPKNFAELCGFTFFVPLADAKLKGALSKLRFNQVVRATIFYGGNSEFPHEYVLSELAVDATPNVRAGTCPSRNGLLISYRGLVEYVNVYNDGTILYQEEWNNRK